MVVVKNRFIRVRSNTRPGTRQQTPRAIVIHYTGNPGATAENHFHYFNNGAGGRYASAHYFIDKKETLLLIPENETTFAANETGYSKVSYLQGLTSSNGYRGNANSGAVHIELCIERDGSYHPNTIKQAQELSSVLMARYGIPISRVIRHYDITGKACPRGLNWAAFKSGIGSIKSSTTGRTGPREGNYVFILKDTPVIRDGKTVRVTKKGSFFKFYGETETHFDVGGRQYVAKKDSSRHKGIYRTNREMNLRDKPSFDGKVIGKLKSGTWRAYDKKDFWINVGTGWVSNYNGEFGTEEWF